MRRQIEAVPKILRFLRVISVFTEIQKVHTSKYSAAEVINRSCLKKTSRTDLDTFKILFILRDRIQFSCYLKIQQKQ